MRQQTPPIVPPVPAPEHLSEKSKELWTSLTRDKVTTPSRQTLLLAGLEALDRSEQCRLAIEQEGMVTITARSGVGHPHPLLRIEKEAKSLFAKIWNQLKLDNPSSERWLP